MSCRRLNTVLIDVIALIVAFAAVPPASADWPEAQDVPAWAHRGALRWVQGGAPDAAHARDMIDQGINLLWGDYGTHSSELIAFLRAGGVHRTTYICSTSIFWDPKDPANIFAQFPPLKQATALEPNG